MAPEAIPLLLKWITSERPAWKDKLLEQIYKLPGHPTLKMNPTTPVFGSLLFEDNYRLGVLGFRALGTNGAPAVPVLANLMLHTNRNISTAALVALDCIGQQGLPAFLGALTNASAHQRSLAAANIGCLVRSTMDLTDAVAPLVRALDDPDRWVPANAASSLGKICLQPEVSVPALKRALGHPNAIVRAKAAAALAKFPGQRSYAVSALQLLLNDHSPTARTDAYLALDTLTNATPR